VFSNRANDSPQYAASNSNNPNQLIWVNFGQNVIDHGRTSALVYIKTQGTSFANPDYCPGFARQFPFAR
jgi:hypothetical protein